MFASKILATTQKELQTHTDLKFTYDIKKQLENTQR